MGMVLPRNWCFYDRFGTMVALVKKVSMVMFATVFTKVSGVHRLLGVRSSASSFSLCGHNLYCNFQH
jgi:hypothetical protein